MSPGLEDARASPALPFVPVSASYYVGGGDLVPSPGPCPKPKE